MKPPSDNDTGLFEKQKKKPWPKMIVLLHTDNLGYLSYTARIERKVCFFFKLQENLIIHKGSNGREVTNKAI